MTDVIKHCQWIYIRTIVMIILDVSPVSIVPIMHYLLHLCFPSENQFLQHCAYTKPYQLRKWATNITNLNQHRQWDLNLLPFACFCYRYHKVGILVLFLHDITDIILESTKLAVYYKTKGGRWFTIGDFLSTAGFLLFGITW